MSDPSSTFKVIERKKNRKQAEGRPPRSVKELVEQAQHDLRRDPWFLNYEGVLLEFTSSLPDKPEKVLCLGLGSLADSVPARFQLALLLDLCRRFALGPNVIDMYDPIFTKVDVEYLNDIGIHVLSAEQADRPCFDTRTLLYMPHCDRHLYNTIFSNNWTKDGLGKIILLGNNLKSYAESIPSKRLEEESPFIARITACIISVPLPPGFPLHISAFNDLAFQFVAVDTPPQSEDNFGT